MKKRFVFEEAGRAKFWEIECKGSIVHVLYGRVGTDGRSSDKETGSPAAADKHAEKLIASKLKKGYQPVGAQPAPKKAPKKTAKKAPKKTAKKAPKKTAPGGRIAAAVDAWRAFAAEVKKNPLFQVKYRFGKAITDPALARIQKAWVGHTLPGSVVEFLRVVDGFEFEVRQADGKAGVFVDGMDQDPPAHVFWGSKHHADGPADLTFGDDDDAPRRMFLMLDEPAPEWCYGFLMEEDMGDNPSVSFHKAAEEPVLKRLDLADYLEDSLAETKAAVTEAEGLLVNGKSPSQLADAGATFDALFEAAHVSLLERNGMPSKALKASTVTAAVPALHIRIKDRSQHFDMGLLAPFTGLKRLSIMDAPPSIELAPLQSKKKLTSLSLWMVRPETLKDKKQVYLPDLAKVKLPSVESLELLNVGHLTDWSALGAFPNVRVVGIIFAGSDREVGALDIWPKAETIEISGEGEERTKLLSPVRLSKTVRQLGLRMFLFEKIPKFAGGASLQELYLDYNHITKLKGLDGLKSLKVLSMAGNRLQVISNLEALNELETLKLSDNQITAIAGLEGFDKLKALDLQGNLLTDLDGLDGLAAGCELRLAKCGLKAQESALKKKYKKRLRFRFS